MVKNASEIIWSDSFDFGLPGTNLFLSIPYLNVGEVVAALFIKHGVEPHTVNAYDISGSGRFGKAG